MNEIDSHFKVGVIVTAIDGENLVLETLDNKNRIQWPLRSVPMPLQIGSELTLELQQSVADTNPLAIKYKTARDSSSPAPDSPDSDEQKRRLLESLVN